MTLEPPTGGAFGRLRALPEEVLFFGRLAIYGVVVGVVYWFLTYEPMGSVLLTLVGVASGALTLLLWRRRRRADEPAAGELPGVDAVEGPFGDHGGRLPPPTFAPLEVGLGIAVASLSLAFGLWLLIAAIVPLLGGFLTWLWAAEGEYRAVEADSAARADATAGSAEPG